MKHSEALHIYGLCMCVCVCVCVFSQGSIVLCVLSRFSCVCLFETLWTVARQAPLSMGFSRQEYWSALPCPPPGHLPDSGFEPVSLMSPALADRFFTTSAIWKTQNLLSFTQPQDNCKAIVCLNHTCWVEITPNSRVGLQRKLNTEEWMLLNCSVGEDSWESLGLQGDPTSRS